MDPSLVKDEPSDVCTNVFFNGELSHSRLIRYGTARSTDGEGRLLQFSGRRVDMFLEVPWVVLPYPDEEQNPDVPIFADRWNRVNELLGQEADKWGRTGKFDSFRTPTGEYLESLLRLPAPDDAERFSYGGG